MYGENGSGKTNLGRALFDVIIHLTDKEKELKGYRNYGNLDINGTSEFVYEFKFEEGTLRYHYQKQSVLDIVSEDIYINGKNVISYSDDSKEYIVELEGAETLQKGLFNSKMSFVKYVYYNTVLKDNATNIIFQKFMQYVENMLWFSSLEGNLYQGFLVGAEKIGSGIIKRGRLEAFQKFLGEIGLEYRLKAKKIGDELELFCEFEEGSVNFFEVASRGTCSIALFYYWLIQLENVSFVFIDEFDAFYHNSLSKSVVRELLKLENTQSIMTTHNTDIMNNDLLRPDCYWQIVNGKLRSFSDSTNKELRKAHNLQKMYNAGAFDE